MSEVDPHADIAAMLRLRDGDDLALNELMSRWQEPLVRFLYRYTVSEQDALDLAQETFVRVYEHRTRYDARGKFSTWLYTIAGNLCRNHARWKVRHPTVSLETETAAQSDTTLGDQLPDQKRTPAQDAAGHELAEAVRDAIQARPDDQRTATSFSNTKTSRTRRSPKRSIAARSRSRRDFTARGSFCARGSGAG